MEITKKNHPLINIIFIGLVFLIGYALGIGVGLLAYKFITKLIKWEIYMFIIGFFLMLPTGYLFFKLTSKNLFDCPVCNNINIKKE